MTMPCRRSTTAGDNERGAALFDYNNDGWLDIYLVNTGECEFYNPGTRAGTRFTKTTGTDISRSHSKQGCRTWLRHG